MSVAVHHRGACIQATEVLRQVYGQQTYVSPGLKVRTLAVPQQRTTHSGSPPGAAPDLPTAVEPATALASTPMAGSVREAEAQEAEHAQQHRQNSSPKKRHRGDVSPSQRATHCQSSEQAAAELQWSRQELKKQKRDSASAPLQQELLVASAGAASAFVTSAKEEPVQQQAGATHPKLALKVMARQASSDSDKTPSGFPFEPHTRISPIGSATAAPTAAAVSLPTPLLAALLGARSAAQQQQHQHQQLRMRTSGQLHISPAGAPPAPRPSLPSLEEMPRLFGINIAARQQQQQQHQRGGSGSAPIASFPAAGDSLQSPGSAFTRVSRSITPAPHDMPVLPASTPMTLAQLAHHYGRGGPQHVARWAEEAAAAAGRQLGLQPGLSAVGTALIHDRLTALAAAAPQPQERLGSGSGHSQSQGHSPRAGDIAETEAMSPLELSYMEELRKFIRSRGSELPPGWSVRVKQRTARWQGKERQQKDAFYQSPHGAIYNSRRKVAISLGLISADEAYVPGSHHSPPEQDAPDQGMVEQPTQGGASYGAHQGGADGPRGTVSSSLGTSAGVGGEGEGGADFGDSRLAAHRQHRTRTPRQQRQNKEAQKRYRDRKKARAMELERKVHQLDNKHSELQSLRDEVAHLQEVNAILEQTLLDRSQGEGGGAEEGSRDSGPDPDPRLVQVIAVQDMRIRELQTAVEVERQVREHQVSAEKDEVLRLRARLDAITRENIHMQMRYQN